MKMVREIVINDFEGWCSAMGNLCPVICCHALAILKGQEEIIDDLTDTIRQLNQHIKDLSEYMTPYGKVKDVKAYAELLKEQEAMHWISVKDRLPTYAELKDDCVLVLFDDGAICSTGFDECIENESIFGEWRQNFDPVTLGATDSYWMPLEGVTHWMPIPKLMQEGR